MNNKTAKLLRKAANVMAFFKMQTTGKQVSNKTVYKSLKSQWNGTTQTKRAKTRTALKRMISVYKTQAPEPEIETDD